MENLKYPKNQKRNNLVRLYFTILTRSLVSFLVTIIVIVPLFVGILHVTPLFTFPVVFVVSIFLSPLYSKIPLPNKFLDKHFPI